MLESTSRLLSGLTAWTGVVVPPSAADVAIRSVQVVSLAPATVLAVTVLADATVEKHTIDLPREIGEERVNAASAHLAGQLNGSMRATVPAEVLATGDADTDEVVGAVLDVLLRTSPADTAEGVFVGGASRVASAFDAVETVQEVLSVLEEQLVVVTLLRDVVDRGLQVAIGTETGMETLADAALVVASYTVDGERAGSIGVLGPARMNYPEAMAAVTAVSRRLGDHLTSET
jgi:heat-inducible transcriptional repressor